MSDLISTPDKVIPRINVLTLAVSPFQDIDPEVWFAVFELELTNRNIVTDSAKFSQLIPRLPKDTLLLIKHVLLDPKSNSRYENVKQIVLKAVRPSERARLEQLCGKLQLEDKRPSLLLREMQQLIKTTYMHDSLL